MVWCTLNSYVNESIVAQEKSLLDNLSQKGGKSNFNTCEILVEVHALVLLFGMHLMRIV